MPPNDQNNPVDPNVIDVNLSLLGASDADALRVLTEQLSQINEHLSQVFESSYEGQIRAAGRRTGRSGVTERFDGAPSVGGRQNRGVGPTYGLHEGTSRPPRSGRDENPEENLGGIRGTLPDEQRQREQAQADQERQAQERRDRNGWQLRDVVSGGNSVGRDPGDLPLHRQLTNAWEATQGIPLYGGQPGYGRIGVMIDSLNRARQHQGDFGGVMPASDEGVAYGSGGGVVYGSGGAQVHTQGAAPGYGGRRDPNDPTYNVNPQGVYQSITMPQHYGGVWTGQDYLTMASNHFARSYLRGVDAGQGAVGDEDVSARQVYRARAANTLGSAAASYAGFHAAWQGGKRVVDRLTGPQGPLGTSIRPGDLERTGEQLGLERGQAYAGPDSLGFRVPGSGYFSEAGQEGLRSARGRMGLTMMPGINREQAGQIYDTLESMGWRGGQRDTMAFTTMAPLVQQGQNPETIGLLLDRSVRQGTSSLQEFNDAMSNLGEVTSETQMPLDEFQQAMGAFAETSAQHGQTYGQGMLSARRFAGATGMDPRFGAELQDNSLVQSIGMMRTGLLPGQQGLLGGEGTAGNALEATDMMMKMTQGFHRATRIPIDPNNPNGPKRTIDPLDAHYAAAAQAMGISVDQFRNLRRRRNRIRAATTAEGALEQFGRDVHQTGARGGGAATGGVLGIGGHSHPSNVAGAQLEHTGLHGGPSWDYVEKQLTAAGVDKGEIGRINKMNIDHRVHAAQQALEHAQKNDRNIHGKNSNKVMVEFTGAAEKFFKALQPGGTGGDKSLVNAGVNLATGAFSNPVGPGFAVDIVKNLF